MKLVIAVIKPFKLAAVLAALAGIQVREVRHSEARGYGRQKDHLREYRDDRFAVAFLPKVRVEFCVEPNALKKAVEALRLAARTGRQGDGKIWVLEARAPIPEAASQ